MPGLSLEIVTAERQLLSEPDVDQVTAPSADGEITILPRHASLIALLQPGELRVRKRGVDTSYAVTGGFLEVHQSRVRILADAAEPSDEIDLQRAQAAEERAKARIAQRGQIPPQEFAEAALALRRSMVRLKLVRRRRSSFPTG
jgi:F-type H+-transporting ATPase subunit epsilon